MYLSLPITRVRDPQNMKSNLEFEWRFSEFGMKMGIIGRKLVEVPFPQQTRIN